MSPSRCTGRRRAGAVPVPHGLHLGLVLARHAGVDAGAARVVRDLARAGDRGAGHLAADPRPPGVVAGGRLGEARVEGRALSALRPAGCAGRSRLPRRLVGGSSDPPVRHWDSWSVRTRSTVRSGIKSARSINGWGTASSSSPRATRLPRSIIITAARSGARPDVPACAEVGSGRLAAGLPDRAADLDRQLLIVADHPAASPRKPPHPAPG